MKNILITSRSFGQVSDEPLKMLKKEGYNIEFYNTEFNETEFQKNLCNCHALIIGAHPLSEEAIKCSPNLKIVSKHGAGLDNIDLNITKKYGIHVTNVPAVNSNAVADLTFSLMLDVARKTSYAANSVRSGKWESVTGIDVYNKNISIVGFGEIGKNVARRAIGFSMKVYVYDPFIEELPLEFKDYAKLVSLDEAIRTADFLTLHLPLNDKTRNIINETEIKKMKKSSIIINTSRGGIINERALYTYLENGHLAGAGLDVLEEEPVDADNPLLSLPQVTITPHMGMYSYEAINAVSIIAAKNVIDYFKNN